MNKIKIKDDKITSNLDANIELVINEKNDFLNVTSVKIKILKNTNLTIEYSGKESKLDIFYNIYPNVNVNITEVKQTEEIKMQNKYYIEENAKVNVTKFNDITTTKEMTIINLNGMNASINYNFKTISKGQEKYDILVYHNAQQTESNIKNSGVNIQEGNLSFNVSSFAPKGKKECKINQSNRIINLTKNQCTIKPNLFIDENDVIANHSALIGTFSDDELFYMQSRGITKKQAEILLIKGFLLSNIESKQIKKIINSYWR